MCSVSRLDTINGMKSMNFQFSNNVTLLGSGEFRRKTLDEALTLAPHLVAADGAAGLALAMGHMPELVIGDMDSLDEASRAALPESRLHQISEQDSTDFDKALRSVSAPLVLGVGFMGARLDHELACYNSLVRWPEKPCILIGETDICFHVPERISLDLPAGSRLSLFPLAEVKAHGSGVVHPLDGLVLSPWGRIGTSNAADAGGQVRLRFDGPGMLLITPRASLGAVVAALS